MQTSEPCAWKLLMGARCLVGLSRFGKLNQNTLKTSFKMEMPPECTDKNIPKKKLTLGLWLLLMLKKKKNVHEKQRSLQGQLYCHAWKMQRMYFYTMLPKFPNCVSFFFSINTVLTQFTCVPLFQCYPFVKWYMVFCSEVSQKYILARGTARWKQATPSGSKQQLQVEVGPLTVLIAHFSGPKFPFAVLRAQSC